MEDNRDLIPAEIRELIGVEQVSLKFENTAKTFFIRSIDSAGKYLKVQKIGSTETLETQAKRLLWLQHKLPVPNVIDYGVKGEYEYLITLGLPGFEASNDIFKTNIDHMISLLAQGLKKIHDTPIDDCPYDNSFGRLMKVIQYNIKHGIIDTYGLHRKFGEINLDVLVDEIEMYSKDLNEDLVFTHGDYSLPNIIINNGEISGFIDLGNCGIADRYYDLGVVEKSIIRNCGTEYIMLFYDEYGMESVDHEKKRFYQLVEHLVWP
jgi:aminoglycoside phosphotransferase